MLQLYCEFNKKHYDLENNYNTMNISFMQVLHCCTHNVMLFQAPHQYTYVATLSEQEHCGIYRDNIIVWQVLYVSSLFLALFSL
jgi:hypothetical protein